MATFDLYHVGNDAPAAPDASGVFQIKPDFVGGQEHGERGALTWTHIGYFDAALDIRDAYTGNNGSTLQDVIYVPDKTGTKFFVMFIENMDGVKRVYLDRSAPNWPTNDI